MSEEIVGMPAAVLLPASRYNLKYISEMVELKVPRQGIFPDDSSRPGASFNISPESGVVLMGYLTEALLSEVQYPRLKEKEVFIISALEVEEDKVLVVGRVARIETEE
jgi:hypothetical protein